MIVILSELFECKINDMPCRIEVKLERYEEATPVYVYETVVEALNNNLIRATAHRCSNKSDSIGYAIDKMVTELEDKSSRIFISSHKSVSHLNQLK